MSGRSRSSSARSATVTVEDEELSDARLLGSTQPSNLWPHEFSMAEIRRILHETRERWEHNTPERPILLCEELSNGKPMDLLALDMTISHIQNRETQHKAARERRSQLAKKQQQQQQAQTEMEMD